MIFSFLTLSNQSNLYTLVSGLNLYLLLKSYDFIAFVLIALFKYLINIYAFQDLQFGGYTHHDAKEGNTLTAHYLSHVCLIYFFTFSFNPERSFSSTLICCILLYSSSAVLKVNPFQLFLTSSGNASNQMARTGIPEPNMSTTFIGRSSPELEQWRHTPISHIDSKTGQSSAYSQIASTLICFQLTFFSSISFKYLYFYGPFPVINVRMNFLPPLLSYISRASNKILKSQSFVQEVLLTNNSQFYSIGFCLYFSRNKVLLIVSWGLYKGLSQRVVAYIFQFFFKSAFIASDTQNNFCAFLANIFQYISAILMTIRFFMFRFKMVQPQL